MAVMDKLLLAGIATIVALIIIVTWMVDLAGLWLASTAVVLVTVFVLFVVYGDK